MFKGVEAEIVLVEVFVAIPIALEDVVDMVDTFREKTPVYIRRCVTRRPRKKHDRKYKTKDGIELS